MTMRDEFERQMRAENACTRLERQQDAVGGQYRTISVERAWKRFQAAYAAGQRAEREACANLLDDLFLQPEFKTDADRYANAATRIGAAAIRNRKEQG